MTSHPQYSNGKTILIDIASDHVQELGRNKFLCRGGEFLPRTLYTVFSRTICKKVKVKQSCYRPGQAQRVLRKLRFPDYMTMAQDGGRLSALCTGHLYPQEIPLVLISVRG